MYDVFAPTNPTVYIKPQSFTEMTEETMVDITGPLLPGQKGIRLYSFTWLSLYSFIFLLEGDPSVLR